MNENGTKYFQQSPSADRRERAARSPGSRWQRKPEIGLQKEDNKLKHAEKHRITGERGNRHPPRKSVVATAPIT